MENALKIVKAYSLLAWVYDRARPAWAKLVMGSAETYLEQALLPRFLTPQTRILDLGSGTGANLDRLQRLGLPFESLTGLDLTQDMLRRAQAKIHIRDNSLYSRGDMRHLPFVDQSFDLVLSTWSLSHLSPVWPVFSEASRVLKRDGVQVFLFWSLPPFPLSLVARAFAPLFLIRFVELADLRSVLGEKTTIRRFAGGWGASVVIPPVP